MVDETSATEGAPAQDSVATTGGDAQGAPSGDAGQVTEITDPSRYSYNGRPVKDWTSGFMRHQDYTTKTQEIAQERRYYDNLDVDLERVRANPALADQFRQIYPQKFHGYLRYVSQESRGQPQAEPGQEQKYAQMDPRFVAEFNQMKEANRQREVAAVTAELDAIYDRMAKKYPFADQETVTARAQALFDVLKKQNPLNPNVKISEKQWEALWKGVHEQIHNLSDSQYKAKVKAQIEASRRGGDVGSGGGTPGHAPRQFKTIKEATNQALADIESGAI